jgi:hypothetical protein
VVGDTDGDVVGSDVVGEIDGDVVGSDVVGDTDGEIVGSDVVGDTDGEIVGSDVVGDTDGDMVGSEVLGEMLGDSVGDLEGCLVGLDVDGDCVGDTVGAWVRHTESPPQTLCDIKNNNSTVRSHLTCDSWGASRAVHTPQVLGQYLSKYEPHTFGLLQPANAGSSRHCTPPARFPR